MRGSWCLALSLLMLGCGDDAQAPPSVSEEGGPGVDASTPPPSEDAALPDGGVRPPPPPPPPGPPPPPTLGEIRYVAAGVTRAVDPTTMASRDVLAASYPGGLTRARAETHWDIRDPVTGRYMAQYLGAGKNGLYSVGPDNKATLVPFDGDARIFAQPLIWAVANPAGDRIYLSSATGAFVAARKGADLSFAAPIAIGKSVRIVHDVSPDGLLAVVSGVKPIKWGDPENVVAPRQFSIFRVLPDGTLGDDVSSQYAPFTSTYNQSPHFRADGRSLVHEGDDDGNTGDHLFVYTSGASSVEFFPKPFRDRDFNTPCALPDNRVVFWESVDTSYYLRIHDDVAKDTKSVVATPFPFSGYVRCR